MTISWKPVNSGISTRTRDLSSPTGYNDFEHKSTDSDPKDAEEAFLTDGEDSYTNYSITLGKSWEGLDFALSWIDTTLDDEECFNTSWCDSTLLFSISKSM